MQKAPTICKEVIGHLLLTKGKTPTFNFYYRRIDRGGGRGVTEQNQQGLVPARHSSSTASGIKPYNHDRGLTYDIICHRVSPQCSQYGKSKFTPFFFSSLHTLPRSMVCIAVRLHGYLHFMHKSRIFSVPQGSIHTTQFYLTVNSPGH